MFKFPEVHTNRPFESVEDAKLPPKERKERYINEIHRLAGQVGLSSPVVTHSSRMNTDSLNCIRDTDPRGNPIRTQLRGDSFKVVANVNHQLESVDEGTCVPLRISVNVGIGAATYCALRADSIEGTVKAAAELGERLVEVEPNTEQWQFALGVIDYLRVHEIELGLTPPNAN